MSSSSNVQYIYSSIRKYFRQSSGCKHSLNKFTWLYVHCFSNQFFIHFEHIGIFHLHLNFVWHAITVAVKHKSSVAEMFSEMLGVIALNWRKTRVFCSQQRAPNYLLHGWTSREKIRIRTTFWYLIKGNHYTGREPSITTQSSPCRRYFQRSGGCDSTWFEL